MKRFAIFTVVLLVTQFACNLPAGTPDPTPTPIPTATLAPTQTPNPTSTPPFTPEEINMGTHSYWRETVEAGCEASESSKGAEYVDKTHTFSADFAFVEYGGREYPRTGIHRYESINQSDRPLVLIYSEIGFDLEVYNPGEDTNTTPACLIFRFRLMDK
ncbi:MAG: hypothetical protein R3307_04770 [Anaerolineales bacterium]|nr:hypothetical protein [Anaerolineales bacterium]